MEEPFPQPGIGGTAKQNQKTLIQIQQTFNPPNFDAEENKQ